MRSQLTDYERYIRTEELLLLQKGPAERVNHDELLFQVTHQASELWMKAVRADLSEAARLMRLATVEAGGQAEDIAPVQPAGTTNRYPSLDRAAHLLRRAAEMERLLAEQVPILEQMHPVDYHQIRTALGRGSGQDSPGFHGLLQEAPKLYKAFQGLMAMHGETPLDLLREPQRHYRLYEIMQGMLSVDANFGHFRHHHMALARRIIGLDVTGTGGTNARYLEHGARATLFKELWDAVSVFTRETNVAYGESQGPAPGGEHAGQEPLA